MARECYVCRHPKVEYINEELLSGHYTDQQVGDKYGASRRVMNNHKLKHIKKNVEVAVREEVLEADRDLNQLNSLANKMQDVEDMVRNIYEQASLDGNNSLALQSAKELRGQLETATKVASELRAQAELKNQSNWREEWEEVRMILFEVFETYPEAGDLFNAKLLLKGSSTFKVS